MKKASDAKIRGIIAIAMIGLPIITKAMNMGIDAIMVNPLTTPFNTSIVLIVFVVTGIAISTSIG